jgi:hypothetical protein
VHARSATFVWDERDPGFEIRGVEIIQLRTTISSSAGLNTEVSTTTDFVRGHVFARYQANESGEATIDHELSIRGFLQRVIDAQLADRANAAR